jgi:hypothetical protein
MAGLKGNSHWRALPDRRGTLGVGIGGANRFAAVFFQNWLAASYLVCDRVELLGVFRYPAVGDGVPIPAGRRIAGIELGQVELGDVSREAVDEQPASAPALPARGVGVGVKP